ncbi:MAG: protease complex subunit PrcB family protein [Planctomycetota bacterium]
MRNGTWKMLAVAALLCPAFVLTACSTGGHHHHHEHDHDHDEAALAEPVAIVASKTGDSSALKSIGVMHIKTKAQYDALGDPAIHPDVDFETSDLVIAALGERPTGGFGIEITAIQLEGSTLVVQGKTMTPAADAAVTQALTYPFAAAVIAKTDASKLETDID